MNISTIYKFAENLLLKAIAYKFEFQAEISGIVGLRNGRTNLARCLSRVVANESSGVEDLQTAIETHGYNPY